MKPTGNWVDAYRQSTDVADKRRGGNQVQRGLVPPPPMGVAGLKCTPRSLAFTNKTALSKVLARFIPSGGGGSTGTFTLRPLVYSPSTRFRVSITVAVEPDAPNGTDPAFVTQPTWAIRTVSRNPETGFESPLQIAYPSGGSTSTNLPDGYEFDSAALILRPEITIADTAFSAAYLAASASANLMLHVTWEPNIQISDDEKADLQNLCSITYGAPVVITNNAT